MSRKNRRSAFPAPFETVIEGLSHEGRGICHHDGRIVFVFSALPGERVIVQISKTTKHYAEANVLEVLEASAQRITPHCAHFSMCGGCSMQHLSADDQIELKQQSVLQMMQHANISIGQVISPLRAEVWGYRRKARLGVKFVRKKQRVLVGFRERNKPYLADIQSCPVLIDRVGQHLDDLMALITELDAKETIPQIEVAADDDHCLLVFRHLQELSSADRQRLTRFGQEHNFWIQLQPQGPDSVQLLYPQQQTLRFKPLLDGDIAIRFLSLIHI